MDQFSNYLENALANHVFRNVALTSPATVYLALFLSDPTEADVGTEVSTGGYARQAITFGAPANGVILNSSSHTFTAAGADFGNITHGAIYDALAAGNLLMYGPLPTTVEVLDGDSIQFVAGTVEITIT